MISYRSYKNFDISSFSNELKLCLEKSHSAYDYTTFQHILLTVLNKHAPLNSRLIRGNNKSYMSKKLLKEMWKRAHLKNIANKSGNHSDIINFRRQRNYVCWLNRKERKKFFSSFQIENNKKSFWDACKPFLSSKDTASQQTFALKINDSIISNNVSVANIFNVYFANITEHLNLFQWKSHYCIFNCNPIFKVYL